MKYRRYGKIRLKNHLSNCFFDLFFFLFGILGIAVGDSAMSGVVFIAISIFDVIYTLIPYTEKFTVNKSNFMVYKGRVTKEINLPAKMTVILSYADMCTDLAKRVTLINQTYMLKGEWSISVLEDVSVEKVIKQLHAKGAFRYTNCWVEEKLKQNFVYSFACNQSILEEVLSDKSFTLIIPETLSHMVNIKKLNGDIYIDKGF